MKALQVVSLLPSATEMVCALGATDELVGISHECDFPAEIRHHRRLTRSRISNAASSRDIDAAVREVLQGALSIYQVDEQALAEISPDVIITQDLCEVCAVSLDDVKAAVARLASRENIQIVCLKPTRLEHVLDDVRRVAAALGREAAGQSLRSALDQRMQRIRERANQQGSRPRVVSIEWLDPVMLGGTWMPELIDLAGGLAIGALPGEPAPTLNPAELAALVPDVVLIKPCGFDLERSLAERAVIERQITSVLPRHTRVYLADGNAYFNRPGPRLVESLELLAACVHPHAFADFAETHARSMHRLA